MLKIKSRLRSFSFRVGALLFIALTLTLLTLRVLIYTQSVENAYDGIGLIINAHVDEINEGMEKYGAKYTKDLIEGIIEDTHDKNLYLAFKQNITVAGNLQTWPETEKKTAEYIEVTIPHAGDAPPLKLLTKRIDYPQNVSVLVGYDLQSIALLKKNLLKTLIENMALSFALSLLISLLIVWLLNRYLQRFNTVCNRVMDGDLDYRVRDRHSNDEFDRLAANINRMLDWNKALIVTVKDSGNAIAHDMRTPLSRLRLELRALSERPKLDQDIRLQLCEHVERVDKLIEMFENILNIAKAESRSSTELFESVDITQLVQDVLDFYAPIIEEKQLMLDSQLPLEALCIRGDKQLLGQAILNLVDNACKYTPSGGKIFVSLTMTHAEDSLQLEVADSGIGIPEELREKAKERFFRVDKSRHTTGHGLGLSLVEAVAVLHKGKLILADNHPGLKATLVLN